MAKILNLLHLILLCGLLVCAGCVATPDKQNKSRKEVEDANLASNPKLNDSTSAIIAGSLPVAGKVNSPYIYQFSKTNDAIVFSSVNLPPGLTISTNSGIISGSPTQTGIYRNIFIVGQSGSQRTTLGPFVMQVDLASNQITRDSSSVDLIEGHLPAVAEINVPYNYQFLRLDNAVTFSAIGLPLWATIDANTGVVSGTPNETTGGDPVFIKIKGTIQGKSTELGPFPLTVQHTDAQIRAKVQLGTPSNGVANSPYNHSVTKLDTKLGLSLSSKPAWLSLQTTSNSFVYNLTGTPPSAQTFSGIVLQATYENKTVSLPSFSISINQAASVLPTQAPTPIATPTATATATPTATATRTIAPPSPDPKISYTKGFPTKFPFDEPITPIQIDNGGFSDTEFSISGFPEGIRIDIATGIISGTPLQRGQFNNMKITGTRNSRSQTIGPFMAEVKFLLRPPADKPLSVRSDITNDCDETSSGVNGDPLTGHAWHLFNTGQKSFSGICGSPGADLNVKPIINAGSDQPPITILISDSGLQKNHPDLNHNLADDDEFKNYRKGNPDIKTEDAGTTLTSSTNTNPNDYDDFDHGTSVAGIVGAEDNGVGSIGVYPRAKLAAKNWLTPVILKDDFAVANNIEIGEPINLFAGPENMPDQATSTVARVFNYSWGANFTSDLRSPDSLKSEVNPEFMSKINANAGTNNKVFIKSSGNDNFSNVESCFDQDQVNPYFIVTSSVNNLGDPSTYSTSGSCNWIAGTGGESGADEAFYNANKKASDDAIDTLYNFGAAIITTDIRGCSKGLSKTYVGAINDRENAFDLPLEDFIEEVTNPNCDYTARMNGTSSAAPSISGVVALILEANPQLKTREVKHILAHTAKKPRLNTDKGALPNQIGVSEYDSDYIAAYGWVKNAYGLYFNKDYGFGLADATAAVNMALKWKQGNILLPPRIALGNTSSSNLSKSIPDGTAVGVSDSVSIATNLTVEQVEISITLSHPNLSELAIELTSPSGTKSILMHTFNYFNPLREMNTFKFLSNAFYGEDSLGAWTIKVIDPFSGHLLNIPAVKSNLNKQYIKICKAEADKIAAEIGPSAIPDYDQCEPLDTPGDRFIKENLGSSFSITDNVPRKLNGWSVTVFGHNKIQ